MTCRKTALDDIETGRPAQPGMSLAGACLLARWCPAWRWRELGPGSGVERGNLRPAPIGGQWSGCGLRSLVESESSERLIREGWRTDAGHRGGPDRSARRAAHVPSWWKSSRTGPKRGP